MAGLTKGAANGIVVDGVYLDPDTVWSVQVRPIPDSPTAGVAQFEIIFNGVTRVTATGTSELGSILTVFGLSWV